VLSENLYIKIINKAVTSELKEFTGFKVRLQVKEWNQNPDLYW
jgi:hypothetical protein